MNGVLPKGVETFTGHKVGEMVELMGQEWKIEDIIFWDIRTKVWKAKKRDIM